MPGTKGSWKSFEVFNCHECEMSRRRERHCALPDMSPKQWVESKPEPVHMGRLPIYGQKAAKEYHARFGPAATSLEPPEEHDEGCPGSWYRAAFPMSVLPYERTLLKDNVAPNPILDRCDDPLVIAAAMYLETERLRHRNHWERKTQ